MIQERKGGKKKKILGCRWGWGKQKEGVESDTK